MQDELPSFANGRSKDWKCGTVLANGIHSDLSRLPSPSLQNVFTLVNKFLTERDREKGKNPFFFFFVVKISCMIMMTGDPVSAMRRDETFGLCTK